MEQDRLLKETFIEEYSSAKILKDMNKLKSSLILLSKSLFALCDYLIFKKYNKLPKNHSERFRILELKEPKIYLKVDSVWEKYTDTYSKPTDNNSYDLLNKVKIEIAENEELDKELKEILER